LCPAGGQRQKLCGERLSPPLDRSEIEQFIHASEHWLDGLVDCSGAGQEGLDWATGAPFGDIFGLGPEAWLCRVPLSGVASQHRAGQYF